MRLIAFDLDGTLLKKNSSLEFCKFLHKEGFFSRADMAFTLFLYMKHRLLGMSLLQLHTKVFERLFKGKAITLFFPFLDRFLDLHLSSMIYQPALERLQEGKMDETMILSNSPSFLVEPIAKKLGAKIARGSRYAIDTQGRLCSIAEIMDGFSKRALLLQKTKDFPFEETVAYSDSHLDLPFLECATKAVAVRPSKKLRLIAKRRGWEKL